MRSRLRSSATLTGAATAIVGALARMPAVAHEGHGLTYHWTEAAYGKEVRFQLCFIVGGVVLYCAAKLVRHIVWRRRASQ